MNDHAVFQMPDGTTKSLAPGDTIQAPGGYAGITFQGIEFKPPPLDVSIVDDRHRSSVRASLLRALGVNTGVLSKQARIQIVQEEFDKITKHEVDDDDDDLDT